MLSGDSEAIEIELVASVLVDAAVEALEDGDSVGALTLLEDPGFTELKATVLSSSAVAVGLAFVALCCGNDDDGPPTVGASILFEGLDDPVSTGSLLDKLG